MWLLQAEILLILLKTGHCQLESLATARNIDNS